MVDYIKRYKSLAITILAIAATTVAIEYQCNNSSTTNITNTHNTNQSTTNTYEAKSRSTLPIQIDMPKPGTIQTHNHDSINSNSIDTLVKK